MWICRPVICWSSTRTESRMRIHRRASSSAWIACAKWSALPGGLSAQNVYDIVFEQVARFQAEAVQYDDMALLVVKASAGGG